MTLPNSIDPIWQWQKLSQYHNTNIPFFFFYRTYTKSIKVNTLKVQQGDIVHFSITEVKDALYLLGTVYPNLYLTIRNSLVVI